MDIITEINNLISTQESAYVAGLIAAFTPCVLALIPVFLYRFGIWNSGDAAGKNAAIQLKPLLIVTSTFILSLVLTGLVFQQLLGSDFVNATRLVLGNFLVILGVLRLTGKVNLQFIGRVSNPWLLGFSLPWIISFSPCVLPYFSALLTTAVTGDTVLKFILFGLGLLSPALGIALLGKGLIKVLQKSGKLFKRIEKLSAILIIVAGLYLSYQLVTISRRDIIISMVIIGMLFATLTWRILKRNSTVHNVILIGFTILAFLVSSVLLVSKTSDSVLYQDELLYACSNVGHVVCDECIPVAISMNILAFLIAGIWILKDRPGKKLKFKLQLQPD